MSAVLATTAARACAAAIGQAPAAAVVNVVGKIQGRECVVVANDATIKAGAWYPETIKKILRAQEIAMRNRLRVQTRNRRKVHGLD